MHKGFGTWTYLESHYLAYCHGNSRAGEECGPPNGPRKESYMLPPLWMAWGRRAKEKNQEWLFFFVFPIWVHGGVVSWDKEHRERSKLRGEEKIKFLFKTLTHKVRQYSALPSWTSHAQMAPRVKDEMPHRYRRGDGKHAVEDPVNSGDQGEVWTGNVIRWVVSIQWRVEEGGSQSQKCARLGSCCFWELMTGFSGILKASWLPCGSLKLAGGNICTAGISKCYKPVPLKPVVSHLPAHHCFWLILIFSKMEERGQLFSEASEER